MTRPTADELDRLRTVAHWICEHLDEHGFLVGQAVGLHKAFQGSRRPSSDLARELVVDGGRMGAARAGMFPDDSSGSLDLESFDHGNVRRSYRVKSAKRRGDGTYDLICGLGSSMLQQDPESLFVEERWVLGYMLNADFAVEEIFAAEIVGTVGEKPVHLILGEVIPLFEASPPPSGFTSDEDESLPGYEKDEGDEATGAS